MNAVPQSDDDAIWKALSNPLRRSILDQLRDGPVTTGAIVASLGLDRHPVLQHLAVLRGAGLVVAERRGRERLNHLNAVPIQRIYERWVAHFTQPWIEALVGLERAVEQGKSQSESEERKVV